MKTKPKYRIVRYQNTVYHFDVQQKFWYGWSKVYGPEIMKDCEKYVENKLNYVVKEY